MKKIVLISLLLSSLHTAFAQTVPAYVPTGNLLGWYPFNGNANNEYGTGLNGIPLGGCTLTNDRFGNPASAYHFNGDTSHILIDTPFFNVGWSGFTISNWLNVDTLDDPYVNAQCQIIFNTIPHNGIAYNLNWNSGNHYSFFVNTNPGLVYTWNIASDDTSCASLTGTEHTWVHMVFVKGNDTSYAVYLNGVLDHSFHTNLAALNYYCRVILGRIDTIYPTEAFWGTLDDYGIWNRALAPCEIRRLYHASPYTYITAQPSNMTAPVASTTHFVVTDTGAGDTYQWQLSSGGSFSDISGSATYVGVTTPTLTIAGVTSAMSGYKYRCIVSGTQVCVDTSASGTLIVTTTGLNEPPVQDIRISPNPTDGQINITGVNYPKIRVYNTIGQLIGSADGVNSISLGACPAGLYIVRVFDENGLQLYQSKVSRQ